MSPNPRRLIFSTLTGVILSSCASHAPPPSGPPPVSVATGVVKRGPISTYVTFDGQITPLYQTTLSTADHVFAVAGYSFAGAATNQGIVFMKLKPWGDRKGARAGTESKITSGSPRLS